MYFQGTANFNAATVTGLPTTANSSSFGTTASSVTIGNAGNAYSINGMASPICIGGCLSDETTGISSTGVKLTIYAPFNFRITTLPMWMCNTAPGSQASVDIQIQGQSIYQTGNTATINQMAAQSIQSGVLANTSTQFYAGNKIQFLVNSTGTGNTMTGLKCLIYLN